MWLGIIIGVVVWQVITFIAFLASKEDETVTMIVGGGAPLWLLLGIDAIIYKMRQMRRRKLEKSLVVDENNNVYYCDSSKVDGLCVKYNLRFARISGPFSRVEAPDIPFYPEDWKNCIDMDEIGSARYTPRAVWSQFPEYPST